MKIRLADYIADKLVEHGINHLFTVTGGGAMHLNDAFGNHQKLKCIYNHHEQACSIAAEGYYKASGKMPAVCVTTGPGGTNSLTGVLGAWLDFIPMLIISGQVKRECTIRALPELNLRQFGDQEFNIVDCVSSMTKYAIMVEDPLDISYHIEKALYIAKTGKPGPVWIDIPLDIQAAIIDTDKLKQYNPIEDNDLIPPTINDEMIKIVINKIQESSKPAIIVGGGIRLGNAKTEFDQFVKQINIPIMTAWNSHDLITDDNPLYAGRPGTIGTRGGNFVFQNCDLLLVIGCRMSLRQIGYVWDKLAPKAFKIMIDIDKNELMKRSFKVDLQIHGDCRDFLQKMITSDYRKESYEHECWKVWCKNINNKYSSLYDIVKTQKLNPYVFIDTLFEILPEDQLSIVSNGSACVIPFQTAKIKKGQRLFANGGCASMGYGLPAAIGGCISWGCKKTICIEGDGSIQMNIQELQTISYNKLPIVIFLINNNGYHSIRQTQSNFFKSRFAGVDVSSGLGFPDFGVIAKGYGLMYEKIDSELHMKETILKVLSTDSPILCEVVVDQNQGFVPKSSSKILPDGKMLSAPLEDMFPFLSENEMNANIFGSEKY